MKFFKELQRRNVIKAAISYLVLAFALLEAADIIFPIIGVTQIAVQYLLLVAVVFFPIWLIFAYVYEWTPTGFRKTDNVKEDESVHQSTSKRLNQWIIGGLLLAVGLLIVDRIFNVSAGLIEAEPKVSTIAILPFSNESPDSDNEFFASGIHSDVLVKLSAIKDFRIISRASVMQFKDFEGDLSELGDRLNAKYILEGAVRRLNNQVRISTQLIEVEYNQVIWSDQYDEELENVFELQSRIATQISDKLQANLSQSETQDIELPPTTILSAYDDYLKANFILDKPRPVYDDIINAIGLLENAVEADPKFGRAWTKLVQANSELYNILNRAGDREEELRVTGDKVELSLQKAKELSPEGWQVLQEEAAYTLNVKNDQIEALKLFEKALERNPSDVYSMFQLSKLYSYFGNPDKSTLMVERAFELSQTSGPFGFFLTIGYEMMGDYEKLIAHLERLLELYPEDDTYPVDIAYFKFLMDGKLSSFEEFENVLKASTAIHPWDERVLKNRGMVVAMFNNEFDEYHENWNGKFESHQKSHGDRVCPMVANDYTNHARIMMKHDRLEEAHDIIEHVKTIAIMPVNLNSLCQFNSQTFLPKLDLMAGDTLTAKQKLEQIALEAMQNESFPIGAVEKTVVLQTADLVAPEKVYYYYELVTKKSKSLTSFASICADPWTYPNLLKDPEFIEEVKADGRFVEFLRHFGFLKNS